jgi:galactokinase
MSRAANALLYQRYDRARPQQIDAANVLQQLSGSLQAAQKHLPALSREELVAALEAIRQGQNEARRLEQAADAPDTSARLAQLQERQGKGIDNLANALQDPDLRQMGDALAAPLGADDVGEGCRQLQRILASASRVVEKYLFTVEARRRFALSRQNAAPPEKYRRLVEEYFKDLSDSP